MRLTERDRRELINRLKKIRDPRERDRILWALAGHDEDVSRGAHTATLPVRTAPVMSKPEQGASSKAPQGEPPQISIGAKRLFGFVVPAFFLIFGLIRIGQAARNYFATSNIEAEIPSLITGGIFLVIGLAGVFRAMHPPQPRPEETS